MIERFVSRMPLDDDREEIWPLLTNVTTFFIASGKLKLLIGG